MENVSKALFIAGGVLIALVIISIGVGLHLTFSSNTEEYNQSISSVEVQKFNSNFNVYIGRNDIKVHEIVSAVNMSKEHGGSLQIFLGNSLIQFTSTPEDFIKMYQNDTFSCTPTSSNPKYDADGRIIKLQFTKN